MRITLTAAAGLIALAGLASAQEATAPATPLTDGHLDEVDADDDGGVSQSEFGAFMDRAFAALDKDANGVVSWVEAEVAMIRSHFDTIDADKNGGVTSAELNAQAQSDFAASDRDGDGVLN